MKQIPQLLLVFFIFALTGGCGKEPELDPIPQISFVSISETEVLSFTNAVEVVFSYADQDGDLGTANPDEGSLRVKDSRLPEADWYHVPPMTPDLQVLQIEGTYSVQLNPLFILGNGDVEVASFTLQLRDRAGNWSNSITTPEVRILESE